MPRTRLVAAVLAAAATAFSLTQPAMAAPQTEPHGEQANAQPASAPSAAESNARSEAQRTGRPVEIAEKTTETTAVSANPDGTMTLSSHNQPVRVKRDGSWVAVDNSLARRPDGTFGPKASTSDLAFSGGGSGPLVTFNEGGKSISLSWDSPLPKPVVEGNSATYPGVMPGVDLKVAANTLGYSHVLVVHNAEAAANPELTRIKYRMAGIGLQLSESDGLLKAKDSKGNTTFDSSTPIMWDSSGVDRPGASKEINPANGRVSKVEMTTRTTNNGSSAEVEIKPERAALTGPDVTYPVYIDPTMSKNRRNWITVTDAGWQTWMTNDWAKVGYCDAQLTSECGKKSFKARSYFDFDVHELSKRHGFVAEIWDAGFWVTQAHTAKGCTKVPTVAVAGSDIGSGTTWPGPTSVTDIDTKSSSAGDQCGGAREVEFEVEGTMRDVAKNDWQVLTLGLRAPDEDTMDHWKRFANNPRLDVKFSFRPHNSKFYSLSNAVTCNNVAFTPDARPTFSSTMSDSNDPPLQLALYHEVIDGTGGTVAKSKSPEEISSGRVGSWTSDVSLVDGPYGVWSYGHNIFPGHPERLLWANDNSTTYWFSVRAEPVTQTPAITSNDYVNGYWSRPQNQPGRFSFNANGAKHIAGFTYTFAGAGTEVVPSTADCNYNQTFSNGGWVAASDNTATITAPSNLGPGRHTLHVRSFDEAHKLSPESQTFEFYVSPSFVAPAPTAKYELESSSSMFSPESERMDFQFLPDATASGGKYLLLQSTSDGAWATFEFLVPSDGDYNLTAGLMNDTASLPDQLTFAINGRDVSYAFVANSTTRRSDRHALAGVQLTKGWHRLKVKLNKKPGSTATTFKAAFDYLELSPTTKLDAEAMPVVATDKPLTHMADCCGLTWNSGAQQRFEGDEPGKSFSLEFSTPIEADYSAGAGITAASDCGNFAVSIDGKPIGRTDTTPVDGYLQGGATKFVPLNGVHLAAGKHTITFTTVSTNPNSTQPRHRINLDYLTFLPINNVTAASFTDAMNNKGISEDNAPVAPLDFLSSGLSAQTLAAAGLAPGSSITIGGAKFAMPGPNPSTGNDNVVAIGQTIPFSPAQQVKSSAVGLLTLSTCGPTAARNATITYTDGTTSDPTLPEVHDWVLTNTRPQDVVLPYWKLASGPDRTRTPLIRPVFISTDPNKMLKSITLPNSGASLQPGVCSAALHVLAIAPRPVGAGWVGAWSAPSDGVVVPPDGQWFTNKTVRTVLRPTVTGAQVRVKFSNANNSSPVTISAASVAAQSGTEAATTSAPVELKFSGNASVTMTANAELYSDPIPLPTGGSGNLVVSMHVPSGTPQAPVHGNATAPSFWAAGNEVANTTGTPFTNSLTGSYFVSAVDVSTADTSQGTVVVLGDSLSATAPPGVAQRNTWVDHLPGELNSVGAVLPGGLVNASRAGVPDMGRWKLNDGSGTTARDSAGTANATATGGVSWSTEHNGSAVFNGSNAAITTNVKTLDMTRSFSVSAWVKTRSLNHDQAAVCREGSATSMFCLEYSSAARRWMFSVHGADVADPPVVRLHATSEPTVEWTHLTATFDASTRIAKFYVNGANEAGAANVIPFGANGPLTIGRAGPVNAPVNWFNGMIADVRIHQRALSANDALLTYQQKDHGPFPNTGVLVGPDLKSDVDWSVLNVPNVRTALVALGSTDILRGASAHEVKTALTDLINTRTGLKKQQRHDGTALHVVVTTIPPLGLDANDPREVQRRQLNTDLLANFLNYDADHVVDFDAAVRDSRDAGKLAPQYLTGGVPNDAYHGRLAEYLAEAVNDFPPRAEL